MIQIFLENISTSKTAKKKDIQKHLHLKMALSNKTVYFPIFIESSNRCWLK